MTPMVFASFALCTSFMCVLAASSPICGSSLEAGLLTSNTQDYIIFSGSGYTFAGGTNTTSLVGKIASFPTASPLSGNPKVKLTGTENVNATETSVYANEVIASYYNALAKPNRMPISGDIGNKTLTSGVYFSATTLGVTGNLTLNGAGNSNAVFIFISGTALFTGSATNLLLTGSAQLCHVYWIIGSSATIGSNNNIGGSFNAYASITVGSGTSINGRLHARQTISIDSSNITMISSCGSASDLATCSTPNATSPTTAPASQTPTVSPPSNNTSGKPTPTPLTSSFEGVRITFALMCAFSLYQFIVHGPEIFQ